jgi:hypothetical protein
MGELYLPKEVAALARELLHDLHEDVGGVAPEVDAAVTEDLVPQGPQRRRPLVGAAFLENGQQVDDGVGKPVRLLTWAV